MADNNNNDEPGLYPRRLGTHMPMAGKGFMVRPKPKPAVASSSGAITRSPTYDYPGLPDADVPVPTGFVEFNFMTGVLPPDALDEMTPANAYVKMLHHAKCQIDCSNVWHVDKTGTAHINRVTGDFMLMSRKMAEAEEARRHGRTPYPVLNVIHMKDIRLSNEVLFHHRFVGPLEAPLPPEVMIPAPITSYYETVIRQRTDALGHWLVKENVLDTDFRSMALPARFLARFPWPSDACVLEPFYVFVFDVHAGKMIVMNTEKLNAEYRPLTMGQGAHRFHIAADALARAKDMVASPAKPPHYPREPPGAPYVDRYVSKTSGASSGGAAAASSSSALAILTDPEAAKYRFVADTRKTSGAALKHRDLVLSDDEEDEDEDEHGAGGPPPKRSRPGFPGPGWTVGAVEAHNHALAVSYAASMQTKDEAAASSASAPEAVADCAPMTASTPVRASAPAPRMLLDVKQEHKAKYGDTCQCAACTYKAPGQPTSSAPPPVAEPGPAQAPDDEEPQPEEAAQSDPDVVFLGTEELPADTRSAVYEFHSEAYNMVVKAAAQGKTDLQSVIKNVAPDSSYRFNVGALVYVRDTAKLGNKSSLPWQIRARGVCVNGCPVYILTEADDRPEHMGSRVVAYPRFFHEVHDQFLSHAGLPL